MPTYTHLRTFTDFDKALTTDTLQENVIAFFNWGLLEAGGFVNVGVRTPGVDDQNSDEQLYPLHQEGVVDGRIWQAINTDWVWESALEFSTQPVHPSGVYVNGALHLSNSVGAYAHHINYPAGQIIFDTAIPTNSVVQAEYAWRQISFYTSEVQWFREVVFDSLLLSEPKTDPAGAAVIQLLNDWQVQPPLVIVEPVMNRNLSGYELGNGAHWVNQEFLFHIITEKLTEKNAIADIIIHQQDKTFYLYDVNAKRGAGEMALDWRGSLTTSPTPKMYPALVDTYRLNSAYFSKMTGQDVNLRLPLFRGIVRATLRVII